MLTISLCSDTASLALLTLAGEIDQQAVLDDVADLAARAGASIDALVVGTGNSQCRRITSAEADAAGALIDRAMSAHAGMELTRHDLRYTTTDTIDRLPGDMITFDRFTISDDGVDTDVHLGEFVGTSEGSRRGWVTRRGGMSVVAERGRQSGAQVEAARKEINDGLVTAGTGNWAGRSAILSAVDSKFGSATTAAEHDRLNGHHYTPERAALHAQMVNDRLAQAADVPHDHEAVLLGGLPGAGKGGVLKLLDKNGNLALGIDAKRYIHIDPDGIKQDMLDRGMISRPGGHAPPSMTDGEHAALLHEESTHIAEMLTHKAVARGMNLILDKTFSTPPAAEIRALKKKGYAVRGVFVDISVDESVLSTDKRWKEGGRFVPPKYIKQSELTGANSTNLLAFEAAAREFVGDSAIVDNAGIANRKPKGKIRRISGRGRFASEGIAVFTTMGQFTRAGALLAWQSRDHGAGDAPGVAPNSADVVIAGGRVHVAPAAAVALIENLGTRPGTSDLTKVSINGHPDLFASVARNQLRRVDMPQIPTARLNDFADFLHAKGVTTKIESVDPASLKATQNELDGRKVGQMITAMRTGTMQGSEHPLWISADNRLLDGHHRFAAEAVLSVGESPRKVTVVRVGMPMAQLIGQARTFSLNEGIDSKHHGMAMLESRLAQFTSEGARKAWLTRPRKNAAPAPAPPASGSGLLAGLPGPAELAGMEHTGGPLGSQGGGWYRDKTGQRYLVKPAQSETHAMNEFAATKFYQAMGVPGDQAGIFQNDAGKWHIVKKAIQTSDGKLGTIVGDHGMTADLQRSARDGFAADALASSWDAFGLVGDNVLVANGTLHRIDVGGSFAFRAMGGDKASFNPGKEWVEPTTLRTSNQGKALYGTMSDAEAATQLDKAAGFDVVAYGKVLSSAGVPDKLGNRITDTLAYRVSMIPAITDKLRGH